MDLPAEINPGRISDDLPQNERNAPREATLLGAFDVFALIVNKMIGTGIYTAPTTVFILTESKQLALGLWAVGFFYTIMSMFIYLDYAAVFPYTGGELVYIDEITSANNPPPPPPPQPRPASLPMGGVMPANGGYGGQYSPAQPGPFPMQLQQRPPPKGFLGRIFGDGLLAYTVYAFLFVALFNSAENLLLIGNKTLVAINPDETPNAHLTRFIAIFALMMICLIQLFSSRAGRMLNGLFAIIKLSFLFVLLCFGLARAHRNSWNTEFTNKESNVTPATALQALLVVLYSFEGWENATFVAGEISTEHPGTLRKGFIWAVAVVGIFYLVLNAVFLAAIDYVYLDEVYKQYPNTVYAALFSDNSTSAERGWSIILAISSAGNANTVTYTFSRVKQSIGRMNILPWSSLWKKDYIPHPDRNGDRHKTPLGGLLLEFIATVVLLSATSKIPSPEYIIVPGNLQTIAHCFVLLILGLGLFRLRSREENLNVRVERSWFPRVSGWKFPFQVIFVLIYSMMNGFIFVMTADSNTPNSSTLGYFFKGKKYMAVVLPVVLIGIIYYWLVFSAYVPGPFWDFSLMRAGNVNCHITKEPNFDMENETARRFGHRRNIAITLRDLRPKWRSWIFWFFGGSLDHSPIDAIEGQWTALNTTINSKIDSVRGAFTVTRPLTRDSQQGSEEGMQHEIHEMRQRTGQVEYHGYDQ